MITSPKRLPSFIHKGKVWTVDERLREFRHLVFGEMPEFVPFDSVEGESLFMAWESSPE